LEVTLVKMSRAADLVTLQDALRGSAPAAAAAPAPAATPAAPAPVAPPAAASPAAPPAEAVEDAPAPAPAAAIAGTPGTAEEAQAAWPRLLALVKEKSIPVSAWLRDARVARLTATEIDIAVPSGMKMFLERLENPKYRPLVESVVEQVFGRKLVVRFSADKGGGPSTPAAKGSAPVSDATGDPGVRKILETFGGSKVVGIE
ncbi:MAG TPA: hypothetical protein VEJ18_08705, partial [Planctomycetota bacterium]|nr:hypothetical protein [Planctomycetota bacterium]